MIVKITFHTNDMFIISITIFTTNITNKKRLFFQIDLPLPSMLVCKKITYLYVNYYKIHQKYIFNYQNYLVIKYIKKINFGNSEFKYTEFPKFRSQIHGISKISCFNFTEF